MDLPVATRASRWVEATLILAALMGCSPSPIPPETATTPTPPAAGFGGLIGVTISTTDHDQLELFSELRSLGVGAVFASEEVTSSGGFRALAESSDIDLYIIFPVFLATEELAVEPDLWAVTADGKRAQNAGMKFACPSRSDFRDRRIEQARGVVQRLRPDGLSLDFIHHFVSWESIEPNFSAADFPDTCYCVHCIQAFAVHLGVSPFSIPPQPKRAAAWITANAQDQWVRFKVRTITSMAMEIADEVRGIDPDILINIRTVPWRRDDYNEGLGRVTGQDPAALSEIADSLSPMTYSFVLNRPPDWIKSVVDDLDWVSDCPILPCIQVAPKSRNREDASDGDFEAALHTALEPPSSGVVLQSWVDIDAHPENTEIIRRVTGGAASEGAD